MAFLEDHELDQLAINRMIFHVVGVSEDDPILLDEIAPPQFGDFFLERIRSVVRGNLFAFRERSGTERLIRRMSAEPEVFAECSRDLASDFHGRHGGRTSVGVFLVFELSTGGDGIVYALLKYDNEDVVRYVLQGGEGPEVPRLERFQETFVRKPEAMQKIALVRLDDEGGGQLVVRDRSKPTHISEYFEGFLGVRRVNEPAALSGKLVEAFKQTFKDHRATLPPEIQRSGVNRIYEVMRQAGRSFDPENCEPLIEAIFGAVDEKAPLRRTLAKQLRDRGVSEEVFDIVPEQIPVPRRRRIETAEGTVILFEDGNRPEIIPMDDDRTRIVVVTARITADDVDIAPPARGG